MHVKHDHTNKLLCCRTSLLSTCRSRHWQTGRPASPQWPKVGTGHGCNKQSASDTFKSLTSGPPIVWTISFQLSPFSALIPML